MTISAPTVGTDVKGPANATSVTLDFTAANPGDLLFAAISLADSQAVAPTAPSGWTYVQGSEGVSGAASSRLILASRQKVPGDTTQAFAWGTTCKFEAVPFWYGGASGIEVAAYLAHASTANFVTASITPTSNDRWILMVAGARGTTSLQTFTPDAAMTERADLNHGGASNPFVAIEIADTATAVTAAAHTYTAVDSVTDGHGGTIAVALIPAVISTGSASGSGSGTGAATALVQQQASGSGSGSGTATATAVNLPQGSATASGAGSASASALVFVRAVAAGSGVGSALASSLVIVHAAASGSGLSSAIADGHVPGFTVPRPDLGDVTRPNGGTVTRPFSGVVVRPRVEA